MLTELTIRQLAPKGKARVEVWDERLPGFGIRVSPAGTKSFLLLYRLGGRKRRITLGRYPILSLADARRLALSALKEVAHGIDPQPERLSEHSFEWVVSEFIRSHCMRHNRESTTREIERVLRVRFISAWHDRDIREIKKADVVAVLERVLQAGTPSAANHAYASARRLFNWCVERGLLDVSPCAKLQRPASEQSRERTLSDEELAAIWRACETVGYPYSQIVRLLILTMQRRSEVVGACWREFDLGQGLWTIPAARTKTNKTHVLPLSSSAMSVITTTLKLNDRFVFPARGNSDRTFSGFTKLKRRLDAASGVDEWTLHDLRRTGATTMARLDIAPHVIERILNHSTGTLGGIAGIYNRFKYLPEMRGGLERWAQHIEQLTGAQND
jgi:integrase